MPPTRTVRNPERSPDPRISGPSELTVPPYIYVSGRVPSDGAFHAHGAGSDSVDRRVRVEPGGSHPGAQLLREGVGADRGRPGNCGGGCGGGVSCDGARSGEGRRGREGGEESRGDPDSDDGGRQPEENRKQSDNSFILTAQGRRNASGAQPGSPDRQIGL